MSTIALRENRQMTPTQTLPQLDKTTASPGLDRARLWAVLATIGVNVVAVTALVWAPWSNWRTGLGLNLIDNAILIGFAIRYRDAMMWRLILFGLIVGLVELPSDAWIVDVSKTLDYSVGGGPMIWRSPIWMPLAWEVVAVQFGYVGLLMYERWKWPGLAVTGLLGAINIPFYEEMARKIHWWAYDHTAMFPRTHTPWAIIIGEFFIAADLGYFARWLRKERIGRAALAGLLGGASIFVGYIVPYWLIGRL
jgi:uncharacterized protein DUF6989